MQSFLDMQCFIRKLPCDVVLSMQVSCVYSALCAQWEHTGDRGCRSVATEWVCNNLQALVQGYNTVSVHATASQP